MILMSLSRLKSVLIMIRLHYIIGYWERKKNYDYEEQEEL